MQVLQEESNNLKARVIQMTEINNKLQKEANKAKQLASVEFVGEISTLKDEV